MSVETYVAGARLRYWAALIAVVLGLAFCTDSRADERRPPKLEPFALSYSHTSDVLRGPPFMMAAEGCEPTTDFLGSGVTVVWRRLEIDFAQGVKVRDAWCGKPWRQPAESGTHLALRWYPWRH